MANLLTFLRLLLALPVGWAMADGEFLPAWALVLCLFTAITSDYLDGKIARSLGTASARGQIFDHST
ncbi:MAG: CDP-alcohol phosphatidyltransferase family protein, partial [Pseudomonadota bacterium]|nr:CDP-alcohol phosphatidyltransferase family protein [Pseudomonadota bacterium]